MKVKDLHGFAIGGGFHLQHDATSQERLCCGHPFHRSVYQGEGVVERVMLTVRGGVVIGLVVFCW